MTAQKRVLPSDAFPLETAAADHLSSKAWELRDLLRILRVRRNIILGSFLAVVVVTAIVVFQLTPRYTATALVMLEQRQTKVVDVEAVLSGLPTDPTSVENQVQILRSRSLMSRVVDKLRLDQDSEFNPPDGGGFLRRAARAVLPSNWGRPLATLSADQKAAETRNAVVDRLLEDLNVIVQGRSTAIQIRFTSDDAGKAARVANAIAGAYVEDQLNAKFEATQAATKWLADRVQELGSQVQAAEAAVQQYKAEHGLNENTGGDSVIGQQLGQLNGQLVVARSDLAEQEAKFARVAELRGSGRSADVSQVVASPLIAQLRGQEAEMIRQEAELSSRYGPRHPQMLDIQNQKRNLKAKIDEEVQRVVETVSNDVAIARARVSSLQASLNQLTNVSAGENRAKVRLKELESTATSNRSLYEAFLSRFKETQSQEGIQTPDARIISQADVPQAPSFPNKTLMLGLAAPGGLFLGFLLAMFAEKLEAGFRTGAEVEQLLELPVLAVLPEASGSPADIVVDKPMSSFAEAVRGLQMGLVLSNVDKRPKVVVVTSSLPNEGNTTVAISLARLAAHSGQKVALVEGDLRRPTAAAVLGATPKTGLVEALSGQASLESCLVRDPRSGVRLLAAVGKISNPPDLLGSTAMARLIRELAATHDLVVIDSAPLLPVNDTKTLARLADAVVFVVRWEKTAREAVLGGARALADAGAPVAGVVLARADRTRHQYYSYGNGNYSKYNAYYTE
jgi:succinoglycan biosynthesis transport protein ExoP